MEKNQPPMTSSLQGQSRSLSNSGERQKKAVILARLALHFYRPDFTDSQAMLLIEDMVNDLERLTAAEVETACARYRQKADSRFYPTSGQLLALCKNPFDTPTRNYEPIERTTAPMRTAEQAAELIEKTREKLGMPRVLKSVATRDTVQSPSAEPERRPGQQTKEEFERWKRDNAPRLRLISGDAT